MSLIKAIENSLENSAPHGVPSEEDMAAINRVMAININPDSIFVAPAVMANRNISSYCLNMGDSTLRQMAKDAAESRSYHIMHERAYRNVGTTYGGYFDPVSGEARAAIYLIRGRNFEENKIKYSTSQEITDIQTRQRKYVSVGQGGPYANLICNICNKPPLSFWDWLFGDDDSEDEGCTHLIGMKTEDGTIATARVENGTLVEFSGVDAGAIPGSMIGRASSGDVNAQVIRPEDFRYLQPSEAENAVPSPLPAGSFREGYAAKSLIMFRAGRIPRRDFGHFLDVQRMADKTRGFSTPRETSRSAGEGNNKMNFQEFIRSLAAQGIQVPASVTDETGLAQFLAGLNTRANSANVFAPLTAAGVTDESGVARLLREAEDGRAFAARADDELSKAMIRAGFGLEADGKTPKNFSTYSVLPPAEKLRAAETFNRQAERGLGFSDDGTPPPRQSRDTELPDDGDDRAGQEFADTAGRETVKKRADRFGDELVSGVRAKYGQPATK